MKSFLVIGIGLFGKCLAHYLMKLGDEVMAVDRVQERINEVADSVTSCQCCDCQIPEVVKMLDVSQYDTCFVCVSSDFQGSLEITYNLREQHAQRIISEAAHHTQEKFLTAIGATYVITPIKDMARRVAMTYSMRDTFQYMQLAPDYGIFEISVPKPWIGRTISDLAVRRKYNINIVGIKKDDKIMPLTTAEYEFTDDVHLVIACSNESARSLLK